MDLEADNAPDIKYDAVFKAAQKCQLAFEKISRADREDHTAISLAQLFSANTTNSQSTSVITLNDVRDDFEQFRVWAKNLGVFAPGQASLDYRLRDATDLRDGFVLLLESLSTELMQCMFCINPCIGRDTEHVRPLPSSIRLCRSPCAW